jgi:hypothetical protein
MFTIIWMWTEVKESHGPVGLKGKVYGELGPPEMHCSAAVPGEYFQDSSRLRGKGEGPTQEKGVSLALCRIRSIISRVLLP